jgi:hypothetical protein
VAASPGRYARPVPRFRDGRVGCDAMTHCDGNIADSETAAEKANWRLERTRLPEGRERVDYTCAECAHALEEATARAGAARA